MYCSSMWIDLCAPLIRFMTLVRYWPCLLSGSRSGVSNGVALSEILLNVLAANDGPPVLCVPRGLRARAIAGGGGGLVSRARLACASMIARTVAFAVTC